MGVLDGRRAVVTGAGRGIGRAIAEAMAAEGAAVVAAARTGAEVSAVADGIRDRGGTAHPVTCDITDARDVEHLAEGSRDLLGGPVDTLVNNAGAYLAGRFEEQDLDAWRHLFEVNVFGTVQVTQAFLPDLVGHERSRIIVVASIAGRKGTYAQSAYNATKHAQVGLVRCLALETGESGLRVNAICPGFTRTELLDLDELARIRGTTADEFWASVEAASSIGRTVSLEEIAGLAVFLSSAASDGINGQSIAVDGGVVFA